MPHGSETHSSDLLVVEPGRCGVRVGADISFQPGNGALVRAMTSPFVAKVVTVQDSGARRSRRGALHCVNVVRPPTRGARAELGG